MTKCPRFGTPSRGCSLARTGRLFAPHHTATPIDGFLQSEALRELFAIVAVPAKIELVPFELLPRHGPGLRELATWRKLMNCTLLRKLALLVALSWPLITAPLEGTAAEASTIQAKKNAASGRIEITDAGKPVLTYNYKTIEPPQGYLETIGKDIRKYAVARSNYIHPLYGPDGEVLTMDWASDHPHHRGIYWAWPEVQYAGQLGDLHALQRVFAQPTGKIELTNGPGFAQVEAENLWKWEDKTPIVRELATIRVHRSTQTGRLIDLKFTITALVDNVSLARRGTRKYGGLNVRLSPVKDLRFIHHADPAESTPRRAWSDSVGTRQRGKESVGVAILEKAANPDYPGDFVKYDNLPWFQPTFPAFGTRYALKKGGPLVLEYRLWIRRGGKATDKEYAARWDAFNGQTE